MAQTAKVLNLVISFLKEFKDTSFEVNTDGREIDKKRSSGRNRFCNIICGYVLCLVSIRQRRYEENRMD